MPTLKAAVQAAVAADPVYALVAAGTFGKVTYKGGDQYNIYAADNSTLLFRLRAQADTVGNLRLIDLALVNEANHSSASSPGVPALRPLVQACFAADPIQAALNSGAFGNVKHNGNGTYTVYGPDNVTPLCNFHATLDTQGNMIKTRVSRLK